jgi:hypothetical protein
LPNFKLGKKKPDFGECERFVGYKLNARFVDVASFLHVFRFKLLEQRIVNPQIDVTTPVEFLLFNLLINEFNFAKFTLVKKTKNLQLSVALGIWLFHKSLSPGRHHLRSRADAADRTKCHNQVGLQQDPKNSFKNIHFFYFKNFNQIALIVS